MTGAGDDECIFDASFGFLDTTPFSPAGTSMAALRFLDFAFVGSRERRISIVMRIRSSSSLEGLIVKTSVDLENLVAH